MHTQGIVYSGGSRNSPGLLGPAQHLEPLSVLGTTLHVIVSHTTLFHTFVSALPIPFPYIPLLNAHLSLLG